MFCFQYTAYFVFNWFRYNIFDQRQWFHGPVVSFYECAWNRIVWIQSKWATLGPLKRFYSGVTFWPSACTNYIVFFFISVQSTSLNTISTHITNGKPCQNHAKTMLKPCHYRFIRNYVRNYSFNNNDYSNFNKYEVWALSI